MIHILTGEYPPDLGGVGDYSATVAAALAQERECVHVWTRGHPIGSGDHPGVTVHRIGGEFTPRNLARLSDALNAMPQPRRVVLQWTPHSFGFRSMNVYLAAWVWKRARFNGDTFELMVHEPFLAFGEGNWRQNLAAVIHRVMIAMLLDAASKVWIAIPAWERRLAFWNFRRQARFEWLPVPSNLDVHSDPKAVLDIHLRCAPKGQSVVGHFGTFRPDIANLIQPAIENLLVRSNVSVLLAGAGSLQFREQLIAKNPHYQSRIISTGLLPPSCLSQHLSACDVLLQPYPDGISTRRGSAMAALALGLPLVTNRGRLSEEFWPASEAVHVSTSTRPEDLSTSVLRLLADRDLRLQLSRNARALYRDIFDVRHTVAALLADRSASSRKPPRRWHEVGDGQLQPSKNRRDRAKPRRRHS